MLPTHYCLLDEATSHAIAGTWSRIDRVGDNHTLAGWFGMYVLLLLVTMPVFGGSLAVGRELGRSLFQAMP